MDSIGRIKSYVLRQSRLTKGQKQALQDLWPIYGFDGCGEGFLDAKAVFKNEHPLVLEIGFGNGETLVEMAQKNENLNFIGVEVHKPGVGRALMRTHEQGLKNIRFFCEDGIHILSRAIADNSLSQVNLFFPDPWKKRKHNKRRILNKDFLDLVSQKLVLGGVFHFATDWEDYAAEALAIFNNHADFLNTAKNFDNSAKEDRLLTKFEQRGLSLGHSIWDVRGIKK